MYNKGINRQATLLKIFLLGIFMIFTAGSTLAIAQTEAEDSAEDEAADLDPIVVTGSRIARTNIEGPAPVVVLTSEQMEKEGFTTVYEALNSLTQNVGNTQDDQFAGGFTQNASVIDLRGLGPGRTLLMLDGRRITDYPLPFNGQSNIVNLSSIPLGMVERIEVLLGGASAIYGSDAIAGVINVITKKDLEDHTVSLRYGDTTEGGGESIRAQLTGGWVGNRWSFTYGLEYFDRKPIWGYERDYMDSIEDNPAGPPYVNTRSAVNLDFFGSFLADRPPTLYQDPGAAACDNFPELEYSFRPGRGNYCGRPDDVSLWTIRNAQENTSLFTNFSFELTNTTQLFGSVNYFDKHGEFNTGTPFWVGNWFGPNTTGTQTVTNAATIVTYDLTAFGIGLIDWPENQLLQRVWTESEVGGLDNTNQQFDEEVMELVGGIRGGFGDTWDWELMGSYAKYDLERERRLQVASAVNEFMYGGVPTETDALFGDPIVNIPLERFFAPITPQDFLGFTDIDRTEAESSNAMVQFLTTGELFEMPAGPVGFAGVIEWGTQDYSITLDDRLLAGEFWGFTGTEGGGERDRYAAAAEFRFPLLSTLDLQAAVRYDKYDDATEVGGAPTYNLGLEWRPISALLIRGSYATSFRAPDMHFIYAAPSGFFTSSPDYYLCERDENDVPLNECTNSSVNYAGSREGNLFLEEETGESFTAGFVWEIMENLSISADYYSIKLEDIVNDLSINRLLQDEADCRLGGVNNDPNGEYCQFVTGSVSRAPADGTLRSEQILSVVTGPINQSVQETEGIDATLKYYMTTEVGTFGLDFYYTHVLDQKFAQFAEDPVESYRDDGTQDLRSRFRGTVTWAYKDFSTTLLGNRLGSTLTRDSLFKDPETEELIRVDPQWYFNWSASYNITDDLRANVFVQNLFNKKPPQNAEEPGYPYFNIFVYDPYGREIFVQLDWTFGGR
jgi:outer membrane receptor protein involved in Fe transport